jgi:hypothetical protein
LAHPLMVHFSFLGMACTNRAIQQTHQDHLFDLAVR